MQMLQVAIEIETFGFPLAIRLGRVFENTGIVPTGSLEEEDEDEEASSHRQATCIF